MRCVAIILSVKYILLKYINVASGALASGVRIREFVDRDGPPQEDHNLPSDGDGPPQADREETKEITISLATMRGTSHLSTNRVGATIRITIVLVLVLAG